MKVCDFCGKSQEQVKRIITSTKADICGECVVVCMEILLNDIEKHQEINFPVKANGDNTI